MKESCFPNCWKVSSVVPVFKNEFSEIFVSEFSEITVFSQISIEKNNRIISDDFDLSEGRRTFFEDAFRVLKVKPDEYYLNDTEN